MKFNELYRKLEKKDGKWHELKSITFIGTKRLKEPWWWENMVLRRCQREL